MTEQEIKDIRSKFFEQYMRPHMGDKPVAYFPVLHKRYLRNPLRLLLLKIAENNPHYNVIISTKRCNPCEEYKRAIGYHPDGGRSCYIFVNDKIILIDNFDQSYWKNCGVGRATRIHPLCIDACIKTQYCSRCYDGAPFPVYPFIYPSLNDYRQVDPIYPVYYDDKYNEQFLKCVRNNEFKHSIFMRWAHFDMRDEFTALCQSIPNSDVVCNNSMDVDEWMDNISQSKFSIAIRGNGKWSHRELEICSIGVPLFANDRGQRMWEPFLADVHYIDVNPQNFLEKFEYYSNHYDKALIIAERGKRYYEQHHKQKGVQKIFKEIIDTLCGVHPWDDEEKQKRHLL